MEADIFGDLDNVCVCEIDLVNYTKWCYDKCPNIIYNTLNKLNDFVCSMVKKYKDLHKIELIGDSILIIGKQNDFQSNCINMILLCFDIVESINHIKEIIFESNNVNLRIGVHIGNVYVGVLRNLSIKQVFGLTVNIANRLKSNAIPGTIHISTKIYELIKDSYIHHLFSIGKTRLQNLKGIGNFNSITLFTKKDNCLIAVDSYPVMMILENAIKINYNYTSQHILNLSECFEILKQKYFDKSIVLNRFFEKEDCVPFLKKFRKWEKKHRRDFQDIIVISRYELDNFYHGCLFVKIDNSFLVEFFKTLRLLIQ